MNRIKITQALLASLEFTTIQNVDKKEVFTAGNVLKVGHVNQRRGYCDDCCIGAGDVEAIAHISQLFK